MRLPRGPPQDDAVSRIFRVDHPAATGVDADVAGPPKHVARPHVIERHLVERRGHRACRARQVHAHRAPRSLHEPRAVEAVRSRPTPAIAPPDLLARELHDGRSARGRGRVRLTGGARRARPPCRLRRAPRSDRPAPGQTDHSRDDEPSHAGIVARSGTCCEIPGNRRWVVRGARAGSPRASLAPGNASGRRADRPCPRPEPSTRRDRGPSAPRT